MDGQGSPSVRDHTLGQEERDSRLPHVPCPLDLLHLFLLPGLRLALGSRATLPLPGAAGEGVPVSF